MAVGKRKLQVSRTGFSSDDVRFADAVINGSLSRSSSKSIDEPYRPVVVFVVKQYNGFGAQMLRLIDAMALADALGASVCVHQGKYWNYGCGPYRGWDCYFNRLFAEDRSTLQERLCLSLENCIEVEHLDLINTNWDNEVPVLPKCLIVSSRESARRSAAVHHRLSQHDVGLSRKLAKRMWLIKEETKVDISFALQKAGLDTEHEDYIGVHVRRGDKVKEVPLIPLSAYANAVKLLSSKNDSKVFIATDDGSVVKPLRALLAPRHVMTMLDTSHRHGHLQSKVNSRYMNTNYPHVVQLLAEIEALRQGSHFVGTFSSNLGRFVHDLRHAAEETSVSLDDRWAPSVAWRTFGKPYCLSERANKIYCTAWRSGTGVANIVG